MWDGCEKSVFLCEKKAKWKSYRKSFWPSLSCQRSNWMAFRWKIKWTLNAEYVCEVCGICIFRCRRCFQTMAWPLSWTWSLLLFDHAFICYSYSLLTLTHSLSLSLSLHPILPSVSLCWFAVVAAGVVLLLLLAYTLDRCEFILICLLPGSAHEFVIWIPKCASGFIVYFPRSVGVCVCFLFLLSIRRLFYPITDFCTDYNR